MRPEFQSLPSREPIWWNCGICAWTWNWPFLKHGRTPVASNDPYQRTTEQFLGRTAVLLASLPGDARTIDANTKLAGQAVQLLTTTRLLLDSPVAKDRRMKELLEDLELVLAQVARMQTPRHRDELVLINETLAERDLVPRIRSAVADLSLTQ